MRRNLNLPNPWNDNRNRVPEQRTSSASEGRTEANTWTHPPASRDHRAIGLPASFLQREQNCHDELGISWRARYRDNATTRFLIGLAWGWTFGHLLLTRGKYTYRPPTTSTTTTMPTTCPCLGLKRTTPTTRCPWTRTAAIEQQHRGSLRAQSHNHLSQQGDAKPQQGAFEVLEMDHVD